MYGELEQKYDDVLEDGLTTVKSYVRLAEKGRQPVYLALRPMVFRANSTVLLIGGKLSVFYRPNKREAVTPINPAVKKDRLLKVFGRKLKPYKVSETRVGTHIALPILASDYDGKKLLGNFKEADFVGKLLKAIEANIGMEVQNLRKVKSALVEIYLQILSANFPEVGRQKGPIPHDLVGKSATPATGHNSEIVDSSNVLSLMKKLEQKKAKG